MEYSQELADAICELVAQGNSVRTICSSDAMPAMSSIFKWLREHKEFAEQYARAKELQTEKLADELVEIADDESNDVSGELKMPNSVAVQRARLKVDTRKWLLSKLQPKKYGDKLDMNLAGKDGGPIQAAIAVTFVRTNGAPDGSD
jgi:hypothetical protein